MQTRTLASIGIAALGFAVSGCGNDVQTVTVQGHPLVFTEQSYGAAGGTAGLYCNPLDPNGQYEVIVTDFAMCGSLTTHSNNNVVFHSTDETNLRLIFPSDPAVFKKVPPQTTFTVANTHGCKDNGNNAQAVAFFAHNSGASYDVLAEADSGSITVNYYAPPSNATGSFDLTFGGDHVVGTFNATYCKNLVPGLGQ